MFCLDNSGKKQNNHSITDKYAQLNKTVEIEADADLQLMNRMNTKIPPPPTFVDISAVCAYFSKLCHAFVIIRYIAEITLKMANVMLRLNSTSCVNELYRFCRKCCRNCTRR